MREGVVLEIFKNSVAVLTPEGEFLKIKKDAHLCDIGEEIWFRESDIIIPGIVHRLKNVSVCSFASHSLVAATLLFVFISSGLHLYLAESSKKNVLVASLLEFINNEDTDAIRNRDIELVANTEKNYKESNGRIKISQNGLAEPIDENSDFELDTNGDLLTLNVVEDTVNNEVIFSYDEETLYDDSNFDYDHSLNGEYSDIVKNEPSDVDFTDDLPDNDEPELPIDDNDDTKNDNKKDIIKKPPSSGLDDEYVGSETWDKDKDKDKTDNEGNNNGQKPTEEEDDPPSTDDPLSNDDTDNEDDVNNDNDDNNEDNDNDVDDTPTVTPPPNNDINLNATCEKDGYYVEMESILTFEENEQGEIVEVYKEMPIKKYCELSNEPSPPDNNDDQGAEENDPDEDPAPPTPEETIAEPLPTESPDDGLSEESLSFEG